MQEGILTPDQFKDLSKKIINAVDTRCRIIPHKWFQYLEDIIECRKRRSYYEVF